MAQRGALGKSDFSVHRKRVELDHRPVRFINELVLRFLELGCWCLGFYLSPNLPRK